MSRGYMYAKLYLDPVNCSIPIYFNTNDFFSPIRAFSCARISSIRGFKGASPSQLPSRRPTPNS